MRPPSVDKCARIANDMKWLELTHVDSFSPQEISFTHSDSVL